MMRKLFRASLIAICCLAGIARAEPTTRPSTQPGKSKSSLTDRDSTLLTSQQYAFQFRVPKEWKAMESTGSAGVEIHGYDMLGGKPDASPPTADKSKPKKSRGSSGSSGSSGPARSSDPTEAIVLVVAAPPCRKGATLDDQVKAATEQYTKQDYKLLSDEPVTLGGEPAHAITFERTDTRTAVDSKGTRTETPFKVRERHVIAIRNDKHYDLSLTTDVKNAERNVKLFNRALDSFEFTEPLKTEEKKS